MTFANIRASASFSNSVSVFAVYGRDYTPPSIFIAQLKIETVMFAKYPRAPTSPEWQGTLKGRMIGGPSLLFQLILRRTFTADFLIQAPESMRKLKGQARSSHGKMRTDSTVLMFPCMVYYLINLKYSASNSLEEASVSNMSAKFALRWRRPTVLL